jgi:predicted kinase
MFNEKFFIMMIGLPGSGKDYWIEQFITNKTFTKNIVVLSTDDIFEEYAKKNNISYSQAFKDLPFKKVQKEFDRRLQTAIANGDNIIWNQTNMSVKSRKGKIAQIPNDYNKYAVNVIVNDQILKQQLAKREKETNGSKVIPNHVIENMAKSYNAPSKQEGFINILEVKR